MKKLLIALAAVLVTAASYGQGFVNFSTRVTGGVDAPIRMPDGTSGVGPTYSAALYLVSGGNFTLVPDSVTTFRTGAGAAYIIGKAAQVPGAPAGTAATFVLRAWETSKGNYDTALVSGGSGQSAQFQVTPTEPPAFPADLPASLQGFNITIVPEPSTIALAVLGGAALLFRRRK